MLISHGEKIWGICVWHLEAVDHECARGIESSTGEWSEWKALHGVVQLLP